MAKAAAAHSARPDDLSTRATVYPLDVSKIPDAARRMPTPLAVVEAAFTAYLAKLRAELSGGQS
jgi:hypothetical protein